MSKAQYYKMQSTKSIKQNLTEVSAFLMLSKHTMKIVCDSADNISNVAFQLFSSLKVWLNCPEAIGEQKMLRYLYSPVLAETIGFIGPIASAIVKNF